MVIFFLLPPLESAMIFAVTGCWRLARRSDDISSCVHDFGLGLFDVSRRQRRPYYRTEKQRKEKGITVSRKQRRNESKSIMMPKMNESVFIDWI